MKKFKSLALYALVLALTAVVLLAGCSNAADAPATTTAAETTTTTAAETTTTTAAETTAADEEETTAAPIGSVGSFSSVEEYLNNPSVKAAMDALTDSMKDQGIVMEITGDGNTMVYAYTYQEQMDLSNATVKDSVKTALDAAMESQKDTFETSLSQIRAAINPDVSIKIIYYNADGTEIASYDFK